MKFVCLGDSFTRGYGVDEKDAWISLFSETVGFEVVNKGISGDTTGGMVGRFYQDVVSLKPRYVMFEGGFNDFLCGCPIGTVQSNVMSIVHQAYHNNMVPIVMTQPCGNKEQFKKFWPEFIDIEVVYEKMIQYTKWLRDFASGFSVFYIDVQKITENDNFRNNYYIDGIHMNANGHKIIAEKVVNDLAKKVL